jgi:hypothetical protein
MLDDFVLFLPKSFGTHGEYVRKLVNKPKIPFDINHKPFTQHTKCVPLLANCYYSTRRRSFSLVHVHTTPPRARKRRRSLTVLPKAAVCGKCAEREKRGGCIVSHESRTRGHNTDYLCGFYIYFI